MGYLGPSFAALGTGWALAHMLGGLRVGLLEAMSTPLFKLGGSSHVSLCLLILQKKDTVHKNYPECGLGSWW